jgi:hypothetical protein
MPNYRTQVDFPGVPAGELLVHDAVTNNYFGQANPKFWVNAAQVESDTDSFVIDGQAPAPIRMITFQQLRNHLLKLAVNGTVKGFSLNNVTITEVT